eukprot:TRINITY_DN15880_c0_g1_i1.p1 TRINITY_DN15880_c0_g1~~TRINITY_DN15880_c0_g1_i1.p1  ORF type:complete len:1112 (-),score=180.28 TRINITY_DN15880_c0_g1_i1:492-3827(-)
MKDNSEQTDAKLSQNAAASEDCARGHDAKSNAECSSYDSPLLRRRLDAKLQSQKFASAPPSSAQSPVRLALPVESRVHILQDLAPSPLYVPRSTLQLPERTFWKGANRADWNASPASCASFKSTVSDGRRSLHLVSFHSGLLSSKSPRDPFDGMHEPGRAASASLHESQSSLRLSFGCRSSEGSYSPCSPYGTPHGTTDACSQADSGMASIPHVRRSKAGAAYSSSDASAALGQEEQNRTESKNSIGGRSGRSARSCMSSIASSVRSSMPTRPSSSLSSRLKAHRVADYSMELQGEDFQLFQTGLLQGSLFCSHLEESSILDLARQSQLFRFKAGEAVLTRHDRGLFIFVVKSGSFVVLPGATSDQSRTDLTKPTEHSESSAALGPGCCFGELSLFSAARCEVTAGNVGGCCFGMEKEVLRLALRHLATKTCRENIGVLTTVRMLRCLDSSEIRALCASLCVQIYPEGSRLWQERKRSSGSLYVLKSGSLVTAIDGRIQKRFAAGSCLGEHSLLFDKPHVETLSVEDGTGFAEVLSISSKLLDETIGQARFKDLLWRGLLRASLCEQRPESSGLISEPSLWDKDLESFIACCVIRTFPREAKTLLHAQEVQGLAFLMVLDGQVILNSSGSSEANSASRRPLPQLEPLQQQTHVFGSIESACEDKQCILAFLPQDAALALEAEPCRLSHLQTIELVRQVPIFRQLEERSCSLLAKSTRLLKRQNGQVVIREGDLASQLFVIKSGEFAVMQGGQVLRTLGKFDYFGERGLLRQAPRSATILCISAEAELMVIGHAVFMNIIEDKLLHHLENRIQLQQTKVLLKELRTICVLGHGTFGIVRLMEHKTSGTRYALKCIRRAEAVARHQQENLRLEREILLELDHPFILKLVRTFKDTRYVYFLTEFVAGGELFSAIRCLGLLSHPQARFYTGSLILVLKALHDRNIAYRDLKPENVLLDSHGFIKLIDFGCAKKLKGQHRCSSLLGTPHYMAPEVILGAGYGLSCDVWSLGVCLYEFVCGPLPFANSAESPQEVFRAILSAKLCFPTHLTSATCRHLMRHLLRRDHEQRIGCRSGLEAVQKHAYFQSFRFERPELGLHGIESLCVWYVTVMEVGR